MRLVDVTAQELMDFCRGIGVEASMHPCLGAVILKAVPESLADLILDSCDYWDFWDYDERVRYAHFKGWMCVIHVWGDE